MSELMIRSRVDRSQFDGIRVLDAHTAFRLPYHAERLQPVVEGQQYCWLSIARPMAPTPEPERSWSFNNTTKTGVFPENDALLDRMDAIIREHSNA